jgi:hypothetical protein
MFKAYYHVWKNMQKIMSKVGYRTYDLDYLRFLGKRANHSAIFQSLKSS